MNCTQISPAMALLLLPSSVSTNSTSVRCLITCVASPHVQRIWEGVQTHFIAQALFPFPCFIHNDRKRQHAYLPPIHDRNLYLAKRWYRCAMLHNSGVQDYVDNPHHTTSHKTYRQPQYTTQPDQELIFK